MLDDGVVSHTMADERLVEVEAGVISILEELTVVMLISTLLENAATLEKSVVKGRFDEELEHGAFTVVEAVWVLYPKSSVLDDPLVVDKVVIDGVAEERLIEGTVNEESELKDSAVTVSTTTVGKETGTHVDGSAVEYDHSSVDQDFVSGPNCASTSKSTTIIAPLSILTAVFEAPSLWLQAPCSSSTNAMY